MKLITRKRKGFTLVEILLVVGFIALAGIGIYTVYTKVQMSNAALQEGKNLDTIRAGTKNLFGGTQTYANISNIVLNDARITPDSMRPIPYQQGASSITNNFGGSVQVAAVALGGGSNNGFSVDYPKVPGAVCAKLVTGAGTGWDQVTVGGLVVKPFGTGALDIVNLTKQCAGDNGNGIDIVFSSL